jgi:hypothetical protein
LGLRDCYNERLIWKFVAPHPNICPINHQILLLPAPFIL